MREFWTEIWQTLRRNRWRSLMTAFGVFWGLVILMLLVGFGQGISNGIIGNIKLFPSNTLLVIGSHTSKSYKGFTKGRNITLEDADLALMRDNFSCQLRYLVPINVVRTQDAVAGDYKYTCQLAGSLPDYYYVIPQEQLYGRYLNDIDVRDSRKVCVLGQRVYKSLFPKGGDPSGQQLKVGGIYYTVIGVVQKYTDQINIQIDIDEAVIMPFTTMQQTYNQHDEVGVMCVSFHDRYPVTESRDKILALVKENHFVHPDDQMAIFDLDCSESLKPMFSLQTGLNILMWIVGCGSLLAGLIGISNIMLVTVKERTQEIGIRRALGAKPRVILTQIVSESIVLTVAAGMCGLVAGVWILRVAGGVIEARAAAGGDDGFSIKDPQVSFAVAMAAFVIVILGGVLAGLMPAWRAMKIKAIDALRDD